MRRMYSKEQLQKLIDEVSRLIAIEELDKVVPVPSLAKAGYLMQVNAAGTGYQLAQIGDLIDFENTDLKVKTLEQTNNNWANNRRCVLSVYHHVCQFV